jgi:hypothetical protein
VSSRLEGIVEAVAVLVVALAMATLFLIVIDL